MSNSTSTARFVTFLALAYALLGAAGLTMAIPPGYASPVFPAAGLALACVLLFGRRALFGVWLGSALLNLSHTWLIGTLSPIAAAVDVAIATGSTLQAWTGGWLVNRWRGAAWRDMEREQDAFAFLLMGGMVAVVLSSSFGVTALYAAGIIDSAEILFTWWNWYVGDALGVFVFAPLTLCILNGPSGLWGERRRRIVAPLLLTMGLVWLAFYGTAHWEKQAQDSRLQTDGKAIAYRITDRLITHREVLSSLLHFIEATPDFSFRQFEQFTLITLQDNPDIFALSFNDLVTYDQRPAFEQMVSGLSPLGPFQITERDSQRNLIRAVARPEYVTVRYIVPLSNNQPAVGFDINSEPIRRAAIERARASKSMAVTAPIQLVQEQKKRIGVLELLPVTATATAGDKNEMAQMLGFAVAVVKIDEMIDIATRGHVPAGLVMQLIDPQAPDGQGMLYRSDVNDAANTLSARADHWKTGLRMGDRDWVLTISTTASYQEQHRPWMAWVVGVAGLMFAALLQILMLGMTGRTAVIMRKNEEIQGMARTLEEKVTARTAELRESMQSYRNQFANNSSAMLLVDSTDSAIIDANATATVFYGYPRERLLTMHITDINILPDSEDRQDLALFTPGHGKEFNFQHRLADGSVRDVEVSSSRIQFGGRIVLHLIIHDITVRKQAEESLRQATDRLMQVEAVLRQANETLEQRVQERSRKLKELHAQMVIQEKMASVGQLAAGIAHELNNPLNFVSLNFVTLAEYFEDIVEMFQVYRKMAAMMQNMKPPIPESETVRAKEVDLRVDFILNDAPALFEESRRGFDRIARIIQSMLGFSHVDHTGDFTSFNINTGIEDTLVLARNEYKYIAEVTTDMGKLSEIRCMPEKLNQVFLNLIVNGVQAIETQNRPDKGRITIRTWQDETDVYCEIADNGPGIPANIQNRIFEPFFTTKPPGRGTGLGLSICYDIIVEKHKGTLTVDCPESGGSVFSVRIPKNL